MLAQVGTKIADGQVIIWLHLDYGHGTLAMAAGAAVKILETTSSACALLVETLRTFCHLPRQTDVDHSAITADHVSLAQRTFGIAPTSPLLHLHLRYHPHLSQPPDPSVAPRRAGKFPQKAPDPYRPC